MKLYKFLYTEKSVKGEPANYLSSIRGKQSLTHIPIKNWFYRPILGRYNENRMTWLKLYKIQSDEGFEGFVDLQVLKHYCFILNHIKLMNNIPYFLPHVFHNGRNPILVSLERNFKIGHGLKQQVNICILKGFPSNIQLDHCWPTNKTTFKSRVCHFDMLYELSYNINIIPTS
jgi:hypothetical protein